MLCPIKEVKQLASRHLALFVAAHGASATLPKHHLQQHLWKGLQQHEILLNCFVHERRHKLIKKWANSLENVGVTWH